MQPGESASLRALMKVERKKLGKPDESHEIWWYPERKNGDGSAGRGCRKKRMPLCNGGDRAAVAIELQGYLTRKGADFRNTSQRKGCIEKSLPEEKLNDE